MEELLKKFEEKRPEVVFEWKDEHTEAEGWIVINSLRGGAAAGGTRMRIGVTKDEVLALAKTMEVKFTVAGPPIGGAKSGINFNPRDPKKREVLERWYAAAKPLLKTYYGTGGDMNVDEVHEVMPICKQNEILFPLTCKSSNGVIISYSLAIFLIHLSFIIILFSFSIFKFFLK